jgi:hypothetical protein
MPKTLPKPKHLVWRISPSAPKGEWVDPTKSVDAPPKLEEPEVHSGSWVTSSFDLLNGTDVVENVGAMTPEQFNELFKPQGDAPKSAPK